MSRMIVRSSDDGVTQNMRQPSPLPTTIIGSGNSGTDPFWLEGGVAYMVEHALGTAPAIAGKSTIPGSPWYWREENHTPYPDAWNDIAEFEILHTTDSSSLTSGDPAHLLRWAERAWTLGNGGAGCEIILWVPQYRRDRDNLSTWFNEVAAYWRTMQDAVNAKLPSGQKPARLIPGAWLWHMIRNDPDAPATGNAFSFADNMHGNPNGLEDPFHIQIQTADVTANSSASARGLYAVHAINACCIYGISPHLLPRTLMPSASVNLSESDGLYIRRKIYDLVTTFGRAGVDTSSWIRP